MKTLTYLLQIVVVLFLSACSDITSIGSAVDCNANPSDSSCNFSPQDPGIQPNNSPQPQNSKSSSSSTDNDDDDDDGDKK